MKNILILILIIVAGSANAQTTRKDKKAAKEAAIKSAIEMRHYTFIANYALPQRGGGRQLTEVYYDLRVTKDSVIAYLPYFGRAYFDIPYNPTDGGIKFTSTKFGYQAKERKKGGWEIIITPTDVKNTERLILNIAPDGYSSLSVSSVNRDFITFNGYLKDPSEK